MAYFSNNLRVLVGKLETTAGTMETLTSSDFDCRILNPTFTPDIEVDDENAKWGTGDHGEAPHVIGSQAGTIEFSIRLGWSGTANVAPNWHKFANACGLKSKAYGVTGIGLQPHTDEDDSTMTIWIIDIERGATPKGIAYKFAGCMGNMVFSAEGQGKPYMGTFSFRGKFVDVAEIAAGSLLLLTSPDTTNPDRWLNNTLTAHGVTQCVSSFSLDCGNDIQPVICQSEDTGFKYFAIAARRPRFSINPLVQTVATDDFYNDVLSMSQGTISAATGSGSYVTRQTFIIPRAQALPASVSEREGLVNWDVNYRCLRNSLTAGTSGGASDANIYNQSTFEILHGTRA